jgi:hypothetical protein
MPSGDSSPCTLSTRLLPGFILVQGDESPDAVNGVPTQWRGSWMVDRALCLRCFFPRAELRQTIGNSGGNARLGGLARHAQRVLDRLRVGATV